MSAESDAGAPQMLGSLPTFDGGVAVPLQLQDATAERDPGYRDPQKSDGGCAAPNKLCASTDPEAGAALSCVAVGSDVDNCGECGKQCTGPGATCVASQCSCTAIGFDYCAGAGCMDVSADNNNCGACGNACPGGSNCTSGSCVSGKE